MPTVTLATLRARARERADMVGSSFVSDANFNVWVNEGNQKLHGMLVDALGEEYVSSISTFSTVAGQSDYSLPTGFLKLYGVDINLNGDFFSLLPYMRAHRNLYRNGRVVSASPQVPHFALVGGSLRIYPAPTGIESVSILYAPSATELTADGDSVTYPNGWERFIIVDTAIQALLKEESSVKRLEEERTAIISEIESTRELRNLAGPRKVISIDYSYEEP